VIAGQASARLPASTFAIASRARLPQAARRCTARAVAIAFGLTYGLVAVIGLIDGEDVLTLIPVNSADNVLHVALALLGIVTGLISRNDDRRHSTAAIDRATNPTFDRGAAREGHERSRS